MFAARLARLPAFSSGELSTPKTCLARSRAVFQSAGVGNSVTLFGLYIGGVAPWILGLLIRSGGGWNARPGFVYGLWFLVGMLAVAWLVILFFSRETRGPWRGKDLSLVSMKSCNVDPDTIR